jgi:signal transduction histidine kinase
MDRADRITTTAAVRAAVVLAIVNAMAEVVALLVIWNTDQELDVASLGAWINLVAGPTFPLIAALMLRSRGRDPGRLPRFDRLAGAFAIYGALCAATLWVHVLAVEAFRQIGPGDVSSVLAWVSTWLWVGVPVGLVLLILWFPTGEPPTPRWRWIHVCLGSAYALIWTSIAFAPGVMTDFPGNHLNPLGWRGSEHLLETCGSVGFALLLIGAVLTLSSAVVRYVKADADSRRQLRWVVVAICAIAVAAALSEVETVSWLGDATFAASVLLLPVAVAVALTRRDGYGLPRILLYGALSTILLSAYLGFVALAQVAFGSNADQSTRLVAAGLMALVAAPLRDRLQRSVERLVYGDRGDPSRPLRELGRRLTGAPDELLVEVVEVVSDALRAPFVAVTLAGEGMPAASTGTAVDDVTKVPLELGGQLVGELAVAPRIPGEKYNGRDRALLAELAGRVAVVAHAAALDRDLRTSRASLVRAREEERLRIRRDLHDGLGPALAGIAFGLDATRMTMAKDPQKALSSLADLRDEVHSSIADVRRLVDDLRPADLDQLGLGHALDQYGARLGERGALVVTTEVDDLPPLPPAVEVAAYRIATEALTNAARHSGATCATVRIAVGGTSLVIDIEDDGHGIEPRPRAGIGLRAMRERAAELGGSCSIAPSPAGGTTVSALLPLGALA